MAANQTARLPNRHDRATDKRGIFVRLSPTGLGGVAFGVVAGGARAGPVGALVGAALGGAAGEALEAAIPSRASKAVRNDTRSPR